MFVFLVLLAVFHASIAGEGKAPTTRLNDGFNIPMLALGTYGSSEDRARIRQVIVWAIEAGYRHIDTAALYQNEKQIGEGIADAIDIVQSTRIFVVWRVPNNSPVSEILHMMKLDGGIIRVTNASLTGLDKGLVKRDELFITTKLWNDKHARNQVVPALKASLKRLNLDYVDLYLIHSPLAEKADGSPDNIDILDTWKGMEEGKKLGLTRSIGVSNFNTEQIDKIIANGDVPPAVNQIEVHPSFTQEEPVFDCQIRNITVMAYSPFGFLVSRDRKNAPGPKADDPKLLEIAKKYNKTTSQIVLRYLIDRYLIPVPKSTNKKRLTENIDVFDFRLTDEDINTINKFNSNSSIFE